MTVNQLFGKGMIEALRYCKEHELELRGIQILEWCSEHALFAIEFVDKSGEYDATDITVL